MQSSVIRSGGRKYSLDVVSSSYLFLLLCMGPKYGGVMMVHHSSSTERSLCSSEEYTAYEDLLCILYHHHNHKLTRGVLQMQKYVCDIFRFFSVIIRTVSRRVFFFLRNKFQRTNIFIGIY